MEALAVNNSDSPGSKPITFSTIKSQNKSFITNTQCGFIRNNSYSLRSQNFNPDKMSPPDHWKYRIEKRLTNYF